MFEQRKQPKYFLILFLSIWLILLLLMSLQSNASSSSSSDQQQIPNIPDIIIDTDCGQYPDDVTAIAMINSFADQNKTRILAMMANDRYEGIVPVLDAITNYFNRSRIPIGITKDPNAFDSGKNLTWPDYVRENYPHPRFERNDQAENAITLYRRLLAASPDNNVIILSIGFFTNLAGLLDTESDEYSPLNGRELIRKKVQKMIAMAGKYPEGKEWNIEKQPKAARKVVEKWPTKIIFAGAETGEHLLCGQNIIQNSRLKNSPVRKAWLISKEQNLTEACFDEIAALIAINGYEPFYRLIYGRMEIQSDGYNIWHESNDDNGNKPTRMAYIKQLTNDQDIINVIDPLLER